MLHPVSTGSVLQDKFFYFFHIHCRQVIGTVRLFVIFWRNIRMNIKSVKACLFGPVDVTAYIISYHQEKVEETSIGLEVYNGDGVKCYSTNTRVEKVDYIRMDEDGEIRLVLENLELLNGKYTIDLSLQSKDNFPIDSYEKAYAFEMYSDVKDTGISRLAHHWEIGNA